MFCLVRTGQFDRPQRGVTFLLLDMQAPGVTTQPIRFFSGDYEQSQVFFDNVRVPRSNIVGEVHQGWSAAKRSRACSSDRCVRTLWSRRRLCRLKRRSPRGSLR
jgi:hypothetical protein